MLSALSGLFNMLFGWLAGLLPDSPFADAAQVTEGMHTGLAWLNWFFPVGEMLALCTAWVLACLAVTAVKVALKVTSDVGSKVIGG